VGAILVNVNRPTGLPAYRTAELEYALCQSAINLLVLARRFRQADYAARLADVRDGCPDLREALVLEDDWGELLASGDAVDPAELERRESTLSFDDPVNIQYTSGTTGAPKGATLSHHNILNNAHLIGEQIRLCAPDPLYHCFGCVAAVLGTSAHGF
jgi:fatty-acyl-CoA synthase